MLLSIIDCGLATEERIRWPCGGLLEDKLLLTIMACQLSCNLDCSSCDSVIARILVQRTLPARIVLQCISPIITRLDAVPRGLVIDPGCLIRLLRIRYCVIILDNV